MKSIILLAIVALWAPSVQPAKILAINAFNSTSHSSWMSALVAALGKRGHEITFVNPMPAKKALPNTKHLLQEEFPQDVREIEARFSASLVEGTTLQKVEQLQESELKKCEHYYKIAPFKQLVSPSSKETFDLILLNYNLNDCVFALTHRFDAPMVLAAPFSTNPYWVFRAMSAPMFHAVPHYFNNYQMPLSLLQRLKTLVTYLYDDFRYRWKYVPEVDKVLKETFGSDTPGVLETLEKRAPLALVNIPATNYKMPLPANVIPVGGLHIAPTKPLPQELKEFLDSAKEGVVLMSFGSIVRGDSIAPEKRAAILKAFSKIPQKVLWKWETAGQGDESDVPKNVKLHPWLPQNDILAHPNIRLFISHCGGMSSIESAYHGVPIMAMPFFLDQLVSADSVVTEGRGLRLDIGDVTEKSFYDTLKELLDNPKYRQTASSSKIILQEQPMSPLERAVFWIEFVIRHRTAPHMRSALADLPHFYSLHLDIALLCLLVLISARVLFGVAVFAGRRFKRQLFASNPKEKNKSEPKKANTQSKKNR